MCEYFTTYLENAFCEKYNMAVDIYGKFCATCKRRGGFKTQGIKPQICRHMQIQDYYADDCKKCAGKAIICNNKEVKDTFGLKLKQEMIEQKKSFPPHMSEKRCKKENCKYFEPEN